MVLLEKVWQPGMSAMYVGERVTIVSLDGLFCDLETEQGRAIGNAMQSNLSAVPKTLASVHLEERGPAVALEQLPGVEEAMSRQVAPAGYADPAGRPEVMLTIVQEPLINPDEVAQEKEPMAEVETGKKRKYRPEGYRCDLCLDLPPFKTGMLKAGHVRHEHPKPKAPPPPGLTEVAPSAHPAAVDETDQGRSTGAAPSQFRDCLLAEKVRLLGIVGAIDVVLGHCAPATEV